MSEKDRKVTSAGIVKESSELKKEREGAREGQGLPAEPTHEKKPVEFEETKETKDREKKEKE